MTTSRIKVRSTAGPYSVVYGEGFLRRAATEIRALGESTGVYLLTSPRTARHWRRPIESALRSANLRATIVFDDREVAKNMATVERLCRELIRAGADRHAVIVGAGGGVCVGCCGLRAG